MKKTRQIDRPADDSDKMFDFSRPQSSPARKPAFSRYLATESIEESLLTSSTPDGTDDTFEITEFRARWWPAPASR